MNARLSPSNWFTQFDVTDELIVDVLATATQYGADHADIYFEHSTSTSIGLADRKVNRCFTGVDLGAGIRVVVGDQVGYAYTEDLSRSSLLAAARIASQIARSGGPAVPPVALRDVKIPDYYPVSRFWSEVDIGQRVPLVRQWEGAVFAADPRVERVSAFVSDTDKHILVCTADGHRAADYRPMARASVSCVVRDGDLRETGSYNLAGRQGLSFFDQTRSDNLVSECTRRALAALHADSPPAGEMVVVMGAGSSGILLHEAIGHGMEADFNRKGISIYADRLGKRIAPEQVTIVDDATVPGARGALNVDDEACPTERTVLVRDGILETYLHDRISARHYGVKPTGNGRRESFRHAVMPRMRVTYMENGPHSPEEIIASVDKGIYCETFHNGQVNIGGGDFAFYVRNGFMIEGGKLTRPIKDANLIGNGPQVLETIEMVGNDTRIDEGGWTCGKEGQSCPVGQGMPTIKVSRLSVGGGSR